MHESLYCSRVPLHTKQADTQLDEIHTFRIAPLGDLDFLFRLAQRCSFLPRQYTLVQNVAEADE